MLTERSDQQEKPSNGTSSSRVVNTEFSIWWPKTRQGRDILMLLLAIAAAVGPLNEYRSLDLSSWEDRFFQLLLTAVTSASALYITLIIVRYLAYWFSKGWKH